MKVGDLIFNPFEIQYALLRASMGPPLSFYLLNEECPIYKSDDLKSKFKLSIKDPLINFGFYFPYVSNPQVEIFKPTIVMEILKKKAKNLILKVNHEKSKQILIPGIIKKYESDFIYKNDREILIDFLTKCLEDEHHRIIEYW